MKIPDIVLRVSLEVQVAHPYPVHLEPSGVRPEAVRPDGGDVGAGQVLHMLQQSSRLEGRGGGRQSRSNPHLATIIVPDHSGGAGPGARGGAAGKGRGGGRSVRGCRATGPGVFV